jgi:hypothetical protein
MAVVGCFWLFFDCFWLFLGLLRFDVWCLGDPCLFVDAPGLVVPRGRVERGLRIPSWAARSSRLPGGEHRRAAEPAWSPPLVSNTGGGPAPTSSTQQPTRGTRFVPPASSGGGGPPPGPGATSSAPARGDTPSLYRDGVPARDGDAGAALWQPGDPPIREGLLPSPPLWGRGGGLRPPYHIHATRARGQGLGRRGVAQAVLPSLADMRQLRSTSALRPWVASAACPWGEIHR